MCSGIQAQKRWEHTFHAYLHESNPAEQDWKSLWPYFGWQSEQVVQDIYMVTSRFGGTVPHHDSLTKHFKSRNPVFKIPRRNEPVATDTGLCDTPASHYGSTMAHSLLARILWYVMLMETRARNNLSIQSMIISRQEELWTPLSLMVENM